MFSGLPDGFPKLEALVRAMDAVAATPPPPIQAIGVRLRGIFARAESDGYRRLSAGELRKLPYAYWLPPEPSLPEIRAPLVHRYWNEALPGAISEGPRRAKRWLMPLFFSYCDAFDPEDAHFVEFAARLEERLASAEGETAQALQRLAGEVSFFRPSRAPAEVARATLGHSASLDEAFGSMLLWPGFVDTRLGMAVLHAALEIKGTPEPRVVHRLLEWAGRLAASVCQTPLGTRFAEALLRPWMKRDPPEDVRAALLEFHVRVYGDPRMPGSRRYQWRGVSEDAVAVILRWMAGDTLRGFIRLLEQTADEIWRYRQKFWMAYYNKGHIEEAWLALGWDAAKLAMKLQADQRGLGFGRLEGGVQPDQSVLLLKIGGLVFSEWSHNGSLRAYLEDDPNAPRLYQDSYSGWGLREPASLDFHGGQNQNPELRHMNSQGGTWQRKARYFIGRRTGVHLQDREVILDA